MYTAMVVIVFSKKVKSTSEDEVIIDKKSAQETRATPRYVCFHFYRSTHHIQAQQDSRL